MVQTPFLEGGSHWYHIDGRPCYEVPRADGKGMRNTTVRDARELGLVPSVTGILKVINKPALNNWIAGQYVIAALTLPKFPSESYDEFAKRVVYDANIHSETAANFGTRIHALIEWWLGASFGLDLRLPDAPLTDEEAPYLQGFVDYVKEHNLTPLWLERNVINMEYLYGGKVDCGASLDSLPLTVIDWKTQGTKPGQKLRYYPDWCPQLMAYKKALNLDVPITSVIISSTEPGRVDHHTWTEDEESWGWETFLAARKIWLSPLGGGASLRNIGEDE